MIVSEKLVTIDSRLDAIEHKMSQSTSEDQSDKFAVIMELFTEMKDRVDKQEEENMALQKKVSAHEQFINVLKKENRDLKMKQLAK